MPAVATCACGDCRKCYQREWARNRYRRKAYGTWNPKGDLEEVRNHITELRAAGVGLTAIAGASKTNRRELQKIANGERKWITVRVAEKILAVSHADARKIDPRGVVRRLQALNAIGYSTRDMAARLSWPQDSVWDLMAGARTWISPETRDAVHALYDQLHMTHGGNEAAARSAHTHKYATPHAWDNIDTDTEARSGRDVWNHNDVDPVVVQRFFEGEWRIPSTRAEKEAIAAEWVRRGGSVTSLGKATGWKAERYAPKAAA